MVQLSVRKEALIGEKKLDSFLTLDTNLTSIRVPLLAFDGKLQTVSNKIVCYYQPRLDPFQLTRPL